MISELRHLGFIVKLVVHSFFSEKSIMFRKHHALLISDVHNASHPFIFSWPPHGRGGLFRYEPHPSILYWLPKELNELRKETAVDSFKFIVEEIGQYGLPDNQFRLNFNLSLSKHYANEFTKNQVTVAAKLGILVEVDAGYQTQSQPVFVRMPDVDSSWNGLKSIITTALTMSIAGYSFMTPAVLKSGPNGTKPSEELYIRWIQTCTFLPSIQLSTLSWTYSDKVANISKKYLDLHSEHSATIFNLARASAQRGKPLVRPLWYLAPDDAKTYPISDQFAVGNDIIVAPVLVQGQKERSVYLPHGNWVDQHGQSHSGPAQIKVLTPLEELAYFKRKF